MPPLHFEEPASEDSSSDGSLMCLPTKPASPLLLVFDLDGTLVAESDDLSCNESFFRPGALQFLQWCQDRGHSLAVWTAAHEGWASYLVHKIRKETNVEFEFVWTEKQLRKQERLPVYTHGEGNDSCKWCSAYRHSCDRCECQGGIFTCPCRQTKDLRKVWKRKCRDPRRTVLIENTPQQCVQNYANSIYVPTYDGDREKEYKRDTMKRLQSFVQVLSDSKDVRSVSKCNCTGKGGPHACYQQSWWKGQKSTTK